MQTLAPTSGDYLRHTVLESSTGLSAQPSKIKRNSRYREEGPGFDGSLQLCSSIDSRWRRQTTLRARTELNLGYVEVRLIAKGHEIRVSPDLVLDLVHAETGSVQHGTKLFNPVHPYRIEVPAGSYRAIATGRSFLRNSRLWGAGREFGRTQVEVSVKAGERTRVELELESPGQLKLTLIGSSASEPGGELPDLRAKLRLLTPGPRGEEIYRFVPPPQPAEPSEDEDNEGFEEFGKPLQAAEETGAWELRAHQPTSAQAAINSKGFCQMAVR